TPKFAVKTLDTIFNSKHEIVGVVTSTDKPAGRGRKIQQSDVKQYATKNNIKLFQPEKLKNESFIDQLKALNPDLFVVVAFRMLPKIVWEIPKKGTINLHGSVLPNYRGAAPINWAIINGEKESGVTTFFINDKIDTGDVLLIEKTEIKDGQTAGELHDKLMEIGSKLIIRTISEIESGTLKSKKQIISESQKIAPKLNRNNTRINWLKDDLTIKQFILGLNPYPGAWTLLSNNGRPLNFKIFNVKTSNLKVPKKTILLKENKLYVGTTTNALELLEIQLEGKKKMHANDFIKGNKNIDQSILL
ncbi:MAG: methionyl-tRNA formyltransferase, partial [Flavobacteriales bacterium]|nr:methionyl-tRNA formyltransferase [Flavobacteriales bacterium]